MVVAHVELSGARTPAEVHLKLRLPLAMSVQSVTVNRYAAKLQGPHNDTVVIPASGEKRFEVVGRLS